MTYLLDTNVISEIRKRPGLRNEAVFAWVDAQIPEALFTSTVCILEIELGVLRKERSDPPQGAALRRWLEDTVIPAFGDRVIPFDLHSARRAAAMHVPDPRPERDCMIAATAAAHDLTVVTRNGTDFEHAGVRFVNPWHLPQVR